MTKCGIKKVSDSELKKIGIKNIGFSIKKNGMKKKSIGFGIKELVPEESFRFGFVKILGIVTHCLLCLLYVCMLKSVEFV